MSVQTDKYASYKMLASSLTELGYTYEVTGDDGESRILFKGPNNKQWETSASHISYPLNYEFKKEFSVDKVKAYKFVSTHDVTIPFTHAVTRMTDSEHDMKKVLKQYAPLVVKPSDSSLSKGVTLNISNYQQLKAAIDAAYTISDTVIVQQQVQGDEIRIIVVGGNAVCALLRQTARVTGDGITSLAELIKQENETRSTLVFEHIQYPLLDEAIIDPSLLTSSKVPKKGEVVELSKSTMIRGGCSVYNVIDKMHPEYLRIAEKLVNNLKAGFLSVDIFCKDFTKIPSKTNYYFNEFNSAPVLKLFYGCRDGKMVDIVPTLTNAINDKLQKNAYEK